MAEALQSGYGSGNRGDRKAAGNLVSIGLGDLAAAIALGLVAVEHDKAKSCENLGMKTSASVTLPDPVVPQPIAGRGFIWIRRRLPA